MLLRRRAPATARSSCASLLARAAHQATDMRETNNKRRRCVGRASYNPILWCWLSPARFSGLRFFSPRLEPGERRHVCRATSGPGKPTPLPRAWWPACPHPVMLHDRALSIALPVWMNGPKKRLKWLAVLQALHQGHGFRRRKGVQLGQRRLQLLVLRERLAAFSDPRIRRISSRWASSRYASTSTARCKTVIACSSRPALACTAPQRGQGF